MIMNWVSQQHFYFALVLPLSWNVHKCTFLKSVTYARHKSEHKGRPRDRTFMVFT